MIKNNKKKINKWLIIGLVFIVMLGLTLYLVINNVLPQTGLTQLGGTDSVVTTSANLIELSNKLARCNGLLDAVM